MNNQDSNNIPTLDYIVNCAKQAVKTEAGSYLRIYIQEIIIEKVNLLDKKERDDLYSKLLFLHHFGIISLSEMNIVVNPNSKT